MPKSGERTTGWAAGSGRGAGRVRPRLGALDIAVQLWRAKWLMLGVFTPLIVAGMAIAFALPESFAATSRLHVSGGDIFAYGAAETSVPSALDAQVRSELELLASPVVAQRALAKVTLARAYPDLAQGCRPEACEGLGIAATTDSFTASGAAGNPVISAQFRHASAAMSAEILNALMDAYIAYRADLFAGSRKVDFREQRELFEQDLAEADQAIRAYLAENNLTDLAAERDTLRALYQSASSELLVTQSRARQAEARLANYQEQIETIAPEQELYVEDKSRQTLLALMLERQEKLSRYRSDSRIILELDKRIEQIETFVETRGDAAGIVRRGPNPLHQQVESSITTLQSEVQALRGQEAELKSQISAFEGRQRRLVELQPALQELERNRQVADKAAVAFSDREVDARAREEMTRRGANSVRVLEPATAPVEGASLKLSIALIALIAASFAALLAGLLRALTRSGFATPGAVERTLGLPVVATIQKY